MKEFLKELFWGLIFFLLLYIAVIESTRLIPFDCTNEEEAGNKKFEIQYQSFYFPPQFPPHVFKILPRPWSHLPKRYTRAA